MYNTMTKLQNQTKQLKLMRDKIQTKINYVIKDYGFRYGPGGYTDARGRIIAEKLISIQKQLERLSVS